MDNILDTIKKNIKDAVAKKATYNYKVGEKDTGGGIPFSVRLSIDPDFKKTVLMSVGIFSAGVAAGIATGIYLKSRNRKKQK
jgi:hypothetical protein